MEKMTERMTEIDETIPELPAKDLVSIEIQKTPIPDVKLIETNRRSESTEMSASAPIQPLTRYMTSMIPSHLDKMID